MQINQSHLTDNEIAQAWAKITILKWKRKMARMNISHTGMLGNRRRPKKWYSKTFHAKVMKLCELFVKEYGYRGVLDITESISDKSFGNG
jgi:hypothetical protein